MFTNALCILEQYCIFFTGNGCCEFGLSSKFTPSTSVVLFYILSLVSLLFLSNCWFVDIAISCFCFFVLFLNLFLLSSSLGPHSRNRFQNSELKLLPCSEIKDSPGSIIESAVDLV